MKSRVAASRPSLSMRLPVEELVGALPHLLPQAAEDAGRLLELERSRSSSRRPPRTGSARSSRTASSTGSLMRISVKPAGQRLGDDVLDQRCRCAPTTSGRARRPDPSGRSSVFEHTRARRIVDVVVDVGDDVGDAHDLPFDRARAQAGAMPTGAPDFPFECLAMPSRTSHVRFSPCPSFSSTSTIRRLCS